VGATGGGCGGVIGGGATGDGLGRVIGFVDDCSDNKGVDSSRNDDECCDVGLDEG